LLVAKKEERYERQLPQVQRQQALREVKPKADIKPKPKPVSRIKPIILVAIGFAMAFLVVSRHAIISENHNTIMKLEKTLEESLIRNEQLKVELAACEDLEYIAEVAKNELGMNYPHQAQIQYVELPDDTADSQVAGTTQEQDNGIWDLISSLID
jgi:cell division protein FtsL